MIDSLAVHHCKVRAESPPTTDDSDQLRGQPLRKSNRSDAVLQRERKIKRSTETTCKILQGVPAGPAHQSQILSAFLQTKYPDAKLTADPKFRDSFLLNLAELDLSGSSPLLRSSVDMLSYGHIGMATSDPRLIFHARQSYGQALNRLVRTIGEPVRPKKQRETHKAVVTAMLILAMPNDALEQGPIQWQSHYEALEAYLSAIGPRNYLEVSDSHQAHSIVNLQQPAMFIALAKRRSPILNFQEWFTHLNSIHPNTMGSASINAALLRLRLTQLVEKTEAICLYDTSMQTIAQIWNDLCDLRDDTQTRLDIVLPLEKQRRLETQLIYVSDFEAFNMDIEEHCFMAGNATVGSFFQFNTTSGVEYPNDYVLSQVWMQCLIIDCMLLRLLYYHPSFKEYRFANSDISKEIEQHAQGNAMNICQISHHFSTLSRQGDGYFFYILQGLVKNFFEETGNVKLYGWCQALQIATRTRLSRLAASSTPSLCRLMDLYEGLSSLSRYRMPPFRSSSLYYSGCHRTKSQSSG